MEKDMEKISVIVPLYKGKQYIPQLLEMLYKNYKKIENIVIIEIMFINDYVGEYTADYKDKYTELFKAENVELTFTDNEKNLGIHGTRLKGLEKSNGNIIFFLDQDDLIDEEYLKKQYEVLRHKDIVVCNGYQKSPIITLPIYSILFKPETLNRGDEYKMYCPIVSPGQCLIRKEIIPQYWKENVLVNNGTDDYFLWVLLLANGCNFALNDEKLFYHCLHSNNSSKNVELMMDSIIESCEYLKKYNNFTKEIAIHKVKFERIKRMRYMTWFGRIFTVIRYPVVYLNKRRFERQKQKDFVNCYRNRIIRV